MENRIPARLSAAEGRKFGLTVGAAFLVLGALVYWRHKHPAIVPVFGGLGALLMVAGLLVPTLLGPVNRAWMGLAHLMSKVTTPIFMGVVYFVVVTPIGLIMRLAGRNPMTHPEKNGGFWAEHTGSPEPRQMTRQF